MSELGPRAQRVYEQIRSLIDSGEWAAGTQIPTLLVLAAQFGVAAATARQAETRLEDEGFIIRKTGLGTFVRDGGSRAVLIVDDEPSSREVMRRYVRLAGFRSIEATGAEEALAIVEREPNIALVLSDVRMPDRDRGLAFIRTVRRRWPQLAVAAVTGYPEGLSDLHSTAECPALVVLKPIRERQIEEALRLIPRTELRPAAV